jgi:hypothetical protein
MSSNATNPDYYYLAPGFKPQTLTVAKLRGILVAHEITYPPTAKKPQLVLLFEQHVAPLAEEVLAAAAKVKRSDEGISDAGM